MLQTVLFYMLSFGATVSAIGVVTARSAVYAVLALVATMCFTAGLFALLGAFFVAVIQVLVYAGAILVLFLFIVMMMDVERMKNAGSGSFGPGAIAGLVVAGLFFAQVWSVIRTIAPSQATQAAIGSPKTIGQILFVDYVLPFELTSFLLLAAVVSIVVLAKKDPS